MDETGKILILVVFIIGSDEIILSKVWIMTSIEFQNISGYDNFPFRDDSSSEIDLKIGKLCPDFY